MREVRNHDVQYGYQQNGTIDNHKSWHKTSLPNKCSLQYCSNDEIDARVVSSVEHHIDNVQ